MPTILSGTDYLALPRAPETWLIEPLVPTGGAVTIYGDAKVGKSYAALQLADAIRQGIPWMGFPVRTSGPVVYVQLDTPRSLWGARVQALLETGLPVDELHYADRETLGTWPFDILNPDHANLLRASLTSINPVAVVVDTLREAHRGDENDSTAMQNVISSLVAATQPAALITISHSRKPGQDGQTSLISDQRGSNYVVGRMDAIIRFSKKTIYFTGRAIEEGSLRCHRLDNGLWAPDTNETDAIITEILAHPGSMREHAKTLSSRINRSEEACRSLIRRFLAGGSSS